MIDERQKIKTQINFYISEFSYELIRESKVLQDI